MDGSMDLLGTAPGFKHKQSQQVSTFLFMSAGLIQPAWAYVLIIVKHD